MSDSAEKAARAVARRLREAGHVAWFAGGCVRDRLRGEEPKDFDLATSALPREVLKLFPRADAVGAHFGVVIVREKGVMTEVATFRTDGSYGDGRRPDDVIFSSPEEDAKRRDFTVNGLFEDPVSGEVIDFVGGREDLGKGVLRAIGEPRERFAEDGLRLMRAVRFSVTLGFEIEAATWTGFREMAGGLARISPERVRDEFSKIITARERGRGLDLLVEGGLAAVFFPELPKLQGCEQPPQWHPEGDVFVHTRIALDLLGEDPPLELCLAVLLHDIAKPPTQTWDADQERFRFNGHDAVGAEMAERILTRWRYPNRVIEAVREMVAHHMRFMHVQEMRVAKLKRFMARPTFPLELELHRVDCDSSNGFRDNYDFLHAKREEFASEPLIPEPLVTGRDLLERGLKAGPEIGRILNQIQTEQLEKVLDGREAALRRLEELILEIQ